ncbi:MAG: ABC transporter ATP-binding protein [Telluria sp.]|nr:ABC transporter ATP-binding protein [Telluria sp.]
MTLRVSSICKSFGARKALDNVSLQVGAGEFLALLGPNGAGKTTLFQILSGLFTADRGSAVICGADIGKTPIAALAQLGIVFQQPALDLDLSVSANLQFQADLHGISRVDAKQRIAACLARFGLSERAHDSARVLSGGNRRKVELARALMTHPKLLLMDEATVGIDPASRMQIIADVKALCKEHNMAVLWATHLVDEADSADRIIVMAKGRVQFDGLAAQLVADQQCATLTDAFLQLTNN